MAIVPLKTAAKMNVWSFVSQPGPFWLEPIGPFSIMMSLDKKKRKFLRFYGTSPLWYCVPSTTIGNRCATFRVYVRAHRVGGGGGRLNQCPVVSVQGKSNSILNGSVCDYRFWSTGKLHARPSSLKIHPFEISSLTWWNRARHPIGTSCVTGDMHTLSTFHNWLRSTWIDKEVRALTKSAGFPPDTHKRDR